MNIHLRFAGWLANLLDNKFKVGKFGFGLDPLLDLIPVAGDTIALLLSLYIIWVGNKLEVSDAIKREMIRNVVIDFVLGLIPVVGSVGYFVFKSNLRNLALINKWLQDQPLEGRIIETTHYAT